MKTIHFLLTLMGNCVAKYSFEHSGQRFISVSCTWFPRSKQMLFLYIAEESCCGSADTMLNVSFYYILHRYFQQERDLLSISYYISQAQLFNCTIQLSIIIQETSSYKIKTVLCSKQLYHVLPTSLSSYYVALLSDLQTTVESAQLALLTNCILSERFCCLFVPQVITHDTALHNYSMHHLKLCMD